MKSLRQILRLLSSRKNAANSDNSSPFFTNSYPELKGYEIGRNTYGKPNVIDFGDNTSLKIGNYCSIAENVTILLGGEHNVKNVSTFPFYTLKSKYNIDCFKFSFDIPYSKDALSKGNVVIGNDVWLGHGATILSGSVIEDGAVIGANALVAGKIPAYSICVGNPAKVIKYRFSSDIIEQLLKISWWEWSEEKIAESISLICSENIHEFLRENSILGK